jgi:hypothetical protein
MNGAKIRSYMLVILVVLAAVSMFPSFGGSSDHHTGVVHTVRTRYASTDCGTFPSTSTYATARVISLRGVGCRRATEVAKAYDSAGRQLGSWRCALSHGDGSDLFSCGKGGRRGNLRKWPHALLAKGEGTPRVDSWAER